MLTGKRQRWCDGSSVGRDGRILPTSLDGSDRRRLREGSFSTGQTVELRGPVCEHVVLTFGVRNPSSDVSFIFQAPGALNLCSLTALGPCEQRSLCLILSGGVGVKYRTKGWTPWDRPPQQQICQSQTGSCQTERSP